MAPKQNSNAMNAYKTVDVFGGASYADPHQLITMLMDGATSRLALARGAMSRGAIAEKGEQIGAAITIIGGLQGCLNMDAGDALSNNLYDLYDYMVRRLLTASAANEVAGLEEVIELLKEIKEAWAAIPQEVRDEFSQAHPAGTPTPAA